MEIGTLEKIWRGKLIEIIEFSEPALDALIEKLTIKVVCNAVRTNNRLSKIWHSSFANSAINPPAFRLILFLQIKQKKI